MILFSIPYPIKNLDDADIAICVCGECGAAILVNDMDRDARKTHEEWHERVVAKHKAVKAWEASDRQGKVTP